ncbi:MAG: diguanylate cyclase, partial [Nitrospira sp.]|nr:diguanylate cyclase [Nitrospira sp.]
MVRQNRDFRVLLVEDDPVSVHFFRRTLRDQFSIPSVLDHVSTIDEALTQLKRYTYNLLLVESQLKHGKGLGLIAEMRKRHLSTPFVLMAPMRDEKLFKEAEKNGVEDFVIKNESNPRELVALLENIYRRLPVVEPRKSEHRKTKTSGRGAHTAELPDPSVQDELTGTYTHSYFHDRVTQEYARAVRHREPLSCIMLDIDHFKMINEEWGHRAGDLLLQECALILFENCRL